MAEGDCFCHPRKLSWALLLRIMGAAGLRKEGGRATGGAGRAMGGNGGETTVAGKVGLAGGGERGLVSGAGGRLACGLRTA